MQLTRISAPQLARLVVAAVGLWTLVALGGAGAAHAELIQGTVQSVDSSRIVVDGTAYPVHASTAFETIQGNRVDPKIVTPGTMVVLEVDAAGTLTAVRGFIPN